jgi:hypothetical protein
MPISQSVTPMSAVLARNRESLISNSGNKLRAMYKATHLELVSRVNMNGLRQMYKTPMSEEEKVLLPIFRRVGTHTFTLNFSAYTVTSHIQREEPVTVDMTDATDEEGEDKGKGKKKESKKRPRED